MSYFLHTESREADTSPNTYLCKSLNGLGIINALFCAMLILIISKQIVPIVLFSIVSLFVGGFFVLDVFYRKEIAKLESNEIKGLEFEVKSIKPETVVHWTINNDRTVENPKFFIKHINEYINVILYRGNKKSKIRVNKESINGLEINVGDKVIVEGDIYRWDESVYIYNAKLTKPIID